jgi:hypothetical protein
MMRLSLLACLLPLPALAAEPISIKVEKTHVDFMAGSELVARYHIGESVAKPYFWPVNAPGNIPVTRSWPMKKGDPKEATDHVHQKSLWFCHGDVIPEGVKIVASGDKNVKGVDFWSEGKGHGVIACVAVGIPKGNSIATSNEWRDAAGTKILDERRTISLHRIGEGRLIVLDIDLHASVCPLTFGDTKEGSMGIRVNDEIKLAAKGEHNQMVNANGKSGEKDVWGMLSDWCDYSGEIGGKLAGIALFDDPKNEPRAGWHSRGYGLMAANPFGRDHSGFPARKGQTDLKKLDKGDHLKLRYGVYLHAGDAKDGKVAEAFAQFSQGR